MYYYILYSAQLNKCLQITCLDGWVVALKYLKKKKRYY